MEAYSDHSAILDYLAQVEQEEELRESLKSKSGIAALRVEKGNHPRKSWTNISSLWAVLSVSLLSSSGRLLLLISLGCKQDMRVTKKAQQMIDTPHCILGDKGNYAKGS